jgi:lysophospholipid acyltransferase (LPLAT)-like uncharacterized protein
VLQLAAMSGCPLVPVAVTARRAWIFKGWDRTLLPWPGSRLELRYGAPRLISRSEFQADPEALRLEIEAELRRFTDALDRELGREAISPEPARELDRDG